jgi:hypothetical protein
MRQRESRRGQQQQQQPNNKLYIRVEGEGTNTINQKKKTTKKNSSIEQKKNFSALGREYWFQHNYCCYHKNEGRGLWFVWKQFNQQQLIIKNNKAQQREKGGKQKQVNVGC